MGHKRIFGVMALLLATLSIMLSACAPAVSPAQSQPKPGVTAPAVSPAQSQPAPAAESNPFRIVAGSEIRALENAGIFADFTKATGIQLSVSYKGSVDIKNQILAIAKSNPKTVDAFWAASPIWYPGNVVQNQTSVMRTYIVLAVDPSTARDLGWDTAKGIYARDVIAAVKAGKLSLAMTSASQSNSGATFYLAFLTALKGGNGILTHDDLQNPSVVDGIKALLGAVNRSAESTGDLKNAFVADRISASPKYNAAVLYESLAIEANQQLVTQGKDPLKVFYVKDAIAIADSPLGYVDNGDPNKRDQFGKLVAYLQSADVQKKVLGLGWRTATVGMKLEGADTSIFNPAWGIDVNTEYQPMTLPKDNVIAEALNLYQSVYRKPSFTVFCLDFSGSMGSNGGADQVKDAMDLLLNQDRAAAVSLQATRGDQTVVFMFNSDVQSVGSVTGNDPNALNDLSGKIKALQPGGDTNIFGCAESALNSIGQYDPSRHNYAVVVMTDGVSNIGPSTGDFGAYYTKLGNPIPVYSIMFGEADARQLNDLATITNGAVCDGRNNNMANCFRKVRGNN